MTREEAIKWMEETIQDAEGLLDKCSPALKEEVLEQNEVFKIAISALRSVSREQVDKLWRGEWEWFDEEIGTFLDGYEREWGWRCGKCSHVLPDEYDDPDLTPKLLFCPNCGAPMSDEAMQMVMERLEALYE